jgi:hypothetical protein
MATAKVLSIDAAGELVAKIRELRDLRKVMLAALQKTADIVEENINIIVESCCAQDSEGGYVLSTMNKLARPDFKRYTRVLLAARKAIKKAGA